MLTIGQARQAIRDTAVRAELYRMWHTGQRMGATHSHILGMMGVRHGSPATETLRQKLLEGTAAGNTIDSVVKANPKLVQPFESALLSFGEESGGLEQSLTTLASHFKAEHRLMSKIWSQLTYPLVTSLAAVLIIPLPLIFLGKTSAYLVSAGGGVAVWYAFGGSVIVGIAISYANRPEYVRARLARALAAGMEAGLPLDRVVLLGAEATGHPQIIAHVTRLPARVRSTQPMSETLAGCPAIPREMIAAIKVGEVSGDFSGSLRKLAELYDLR